MLLREATGLVLVLSLLEERLKLQKNSIAEKNVGTRRANVDSHENSQLHLCFRGAIESG